MSIVNDEVHVFGQLGFGEADGDVRTVAGCIWSHGANACVTASFVSVLGHIFERKDRDVLSKEALTKVPSRRC